MIQRSVGVHDGSFHADEVTACALLVVFNLVDEDKIARSRDEKILAECEYVCDVGGVYNPDLKRFDHHQSDYTGSLSSAGMVWLYFKERGLVDQTLYDHFNHMLIIGVDAHDNGKILAEEGVCTFSHLISSFLPSRYDAQEEEQTKAFFEALAFVISYLKRVLERFKYVHSCKEKVAKAMQTQGECLYFDEPLPWMESFFELGGKSHPAHFIIMPSGSHWKLRGIPPSLEERMQVRTPLPAEWAGLLEEPLKEASGIPGAIFCHKGRFICVWQTKEDAQKALDYVLKNKGK